MQDRYFAVFTPKNKDNSLLSQKIRAITNHDATCYSPPLSERHRDIVSIISDESEFKGQLCISHVFLWYQGFNKLNSYENRLDNLVTEFNMSSIHFADLFGRRSRELAPDQRSKFLIKYAKIVSEIPMFCSSFSISKTKVIEESDNLLDNLDDLYFVIRWSNLERVLGILRPYSIIHIFTEQGNNFTEKHGQDLIQRLHAGIQSSEGIKRFEHSVCLNPFVFTKKALLYSSLSDLVAYVSNKVQQKIDHGVPPKKITRQYGELFSLIKSVFQGYGNLSSRELIHMIDEADELV